VLKRVEFTQRGPNTLVVPEELVGELRRVEKGGLAVNNEELAYGLRSIAAPIRSESGVVVAAINLAVHRSMVTLDSLVAHLGPPLKRTAEAISLRLGYSSPAPR
jgi:IclR family transcriptional regulator, pca regulon regulatory protein